MKILLIEPNKQPTVKTIKHTLEAMQSEVGGYIQAIYPYEDEVALVCNEEGKICGLPLNRFLFDEEGNLIDIIAGTFFICGAPINSENFTSLTDKQIKKYTEIFY